MSTASITAVADEATVPVLSVKHSKDCGMWLGHYSCATWERCTCAAKQRPAMADEATVRARIEEAQVVYALPELVRVATTRLSPLCGHAVLVTHNLTDLIAWADHLGIALTASVERRAGKLWTEVAARGELLGWACSVVSMDGLRSAPEPAGAPL